MTVNHSLEFKNKETGAHTNTVEGMWRHAKLSCPKFNRKKAHFLGYLASFMLRKKWKNCDDSFANFMKAASRLYNQGNPPTKEDFILTPREEAQIAEYETNDYDSDEDELPVNQSTFRYNQILHTPVSFRNNQNLFTFKTNKTSLTF